MTCSKQYCCNTTPVIIYLLIVSASLVVANQQLKLSQQTPREDARPIYINPYPATRTHGAGTRFGSGVNKQSTSEDLARSKWRRGKSYLATVDEASMGHQIGSIPSSIGRGEQSQVAEWPFFKSLKSTRNNQNNWAMEVQTPAQAQSQSQELPVTESTTTTTTTAAAPTTTSNNYMELEQTTTAASTITTTTSTTMTTTNTTTNTTTTTTTTTTTPAPETTEQPLETTTSEPKEKEKEKGDPLFPMNLHKSIQEAVNKIVKMGETSGADKAPVVMDNKETRNSLSLNVLLKNFGMNNLSDLDQILLKSRLKPNSTNSKDSSEQKIEIRGLQKEVNGDSSTPLPADKPTTASSGEVEKEEEEAEVYDNNGNEDDYRMAECKIEYTMRHVNISLMNGPRGDYTCDYIIDRKLTSKKVATTVAKEKGEAISLIKVCKLQLTSQFFSNQSNQQCNSTYLSIGELKFCYLQPTAFMPTLDRSFEFPVEREAFDIKMVHKSLRSDDTEDGNAEIHLEIKPLADVECASSRRLKQQQQQQEPKVENAQLAIASTTIAPVVDGVVGEQPQGRSITTTNNHAPPRRKFIVKVAPERGLLHPLNRFKVSQSFDVSSKPTHYSFSLTNETKFSLCDGLVHNMVAGHLATPDYPHYYPANTSCSFDIRRASPLHCQLLLHFRDFDLVNNMPANESQCQDDYLQIGHTRYCNKYAMIGHKMELDFPAATNHSIKLTFRSDHMQSGRGFLVRYQQLLCSSSSTSKPSSRQQKSTTRLGEQQVTQSTIAVPMQQPDFSLALKTTTAPPSASNNNNNYKTASQKKPKAVQNYSNQTATTMVASTSSLVQSVELAETPKPRYEDSPPQSCSMVNNEMSFLIRSPNYPNDYGKNLECLYYVRRNTSQVCYVELTFIKFDLEADADCRYDYLEINNVRLCGSLKDLAHKTTRIYFFSEPIKLIKFRSDDSSSRPGFLLRIDQLQCAPSDGSILRQSRVEPAQSAQVSATSTTTRFRSSNVSRTFEYDDTSLNSNSKSLPSSQALPAQSKPSARQLDFLEPQARVKAPACDQVLFGKEVMIKSPLWPESYNSDENLSSCRYRIQRLASGKNKICQLELRFVNLRLGVSDCIDVDGYEVLCGFNTRNMVNYYPFDRQSHLTITFFTGTLSSKLAAARSLQLSGRQEPAISTKAPLRFMIIAKQHECVDGFLAPQSEFQTTSSYNQTNLLYSSPLNPSNLMPNSIKNESHLNYDFSSSIPASPISNSNNNNNNKMFSLLPPLTCPDGSMVLKNDELYSLQYPLGFNKGGTHCSVEIFRQSDAMCQLELEFLDLDLLQSSDTSCQSNYLQVNQIKLCHLRQVERRPPQKRLLHLPFNDQKYHTITFHADPSVENGNRRGFLLRHRQLECLTLGKEVTSGLKSIKFSQFETSRDEPLLEVRRKLIGSQPLTNLGSTNLDNNKCLIHYNQFNGIMSSTSILSKGQQLASIRSTCHVYIKLLPGYCQVQLSFGEFDLAPRTLNQFCVDYLELDEVAYCGQELKNTSRLVGPVDPLNQRQVHLKYSATTSTSNSSYTFRAIFKQIECQPPEALPRDLGKPSTTTSTTASPSTLVSLNKPASEQAEELASQAPKVEFREILVKGEFFELNSAKLSKSLTSYDPNMFIIYRIKRMSPQVCKLRLMFYQFDLEPSPGCKKDFLDINNIDRLCGQLGSDSSSARRDYDWPAGESKDFLISFVSDLQLQRDGFLVFGQQLLTNCSSSSKSNSDGSSPNPIVTYDEEPQNNKKQQELVQKATSEGENIKMKQQVSSKLPSSDDNCYKLFYEPKFSITSPNWPQKYAQKSSCYYLIQKSSPEICSLSVGLLSLVLDSEETFDGDLCDTSSKDSLLIDGQVYCGLLNRPRMLQLDFNQRQFISLKFTSLAGSGFGFYLEVTQNKCSFNNGSTSLAATTTPTPTTTTTSTLKPDLEQSKENKSCNQLITDEVSFLESDNFPRPYNHNQDCLYAFRRPNNSVCALDLVLNYFELEEPSVGSSKCESDYLEVDYHRLCGSYPPLHRLRFSYFGQEPDKLIRFRSDASLARAGFSLQVAQVSGTECQTREQPMERTKEPESTTTTTPSSDLINYLPSANAAAETLPQSTGTNTAPQIAARSLPQAGGNEPSGGTLCQFVYQRERQFLVSPNYHERRHHYDNNLHCQYKLLAKTYDFCSLRLTFYDLSLEDSPDCHQDYLLIDSQRYCGSNGTKQTLEVPFPESLPREIHLVYHTSAHSNDGRGFKILAEQLPCRLQQAPRGLQEEEEELGDRSSSLEQRQTRRLKFGQLSYPQNYVSEPTSEAHKPQTPLAVSLGSPKPSRASEAIEENNGQSLLLRRAIASSSASDELDAVANNEDNRDDLTLRKEIVVAKSSLQKRQATKPS